MTGVEELVEQLRTIEEQLRDLAYDRLREAAKGSEAAKAEEKKLLSGPAGDREGHPRPRHHGADDRRRPVVR